MNKLNLFLCCLFTLWFCAAGFSQGDPSRGRSEYRGKPLHAQTAIEIYPDPAQYDFNKLLPGEIRAKLEDKTRSMIEKLHIIGMTATIVVPGKGIWQIDTGYISKDNHRMVDSASVFCWMSVGKMITGTIITQLINEKKLSLTDKLSTWYPEFQYANKITIGQLLTHTSGLYSFNSDSLVHSGEKIYSYPELLEVARSHKNLFKPGEYWSYSNTGYLLLGLIAEKIENKSFSQITGERIAGPLHLKTLRALAPREVPDNLALSHKNDIITKEEYAHGGAGNIVSNSKEMVIFLDALLTGKIVPLSSVYDKLKDLYPMFGDGTYYGKGIMLWDFKEIDQKNEIWIGHYGGQEDYQAIVVYDQGTRAFIAVSVNQNISAAAIANTLLNVIRSSAGF